MEKEQAEAIAQYSKKNFLAFCVALYKGFKLGWHIDLIAKKLEAVERGEIKRLMIFVPPRHSKSLVSSQLFPAWYLGRDPTKQIIATTYGDDLARDFGRKVRNIMIESEYKFIFPEVSLAEDSQAIGKFNTNQDGIYIATGIGGAITGRGADLLLIDDPVRNRKDADSEVIRENIWEWYTSTARSRLMPNGAIVIIQTRWHKDDLSGRLLKQMSEGKGEQWEIIDLPAIANRNEEHRKEGDPLWPEMWSLEELQKTRAAIGEREWYCLYQQTPMDPENQIFHAEYFRYYEQLPEGELTTLMAVDPAFKKSKKSDYSAICVVAKHHDKTYVLDYVRAKLNPSELITEIIRMWKKWKPFKLGIEAFAAQTVIGFYLRERAAGENIGIDYEEILQKDDKLTKIKRLEPYFRDGKILIKKHMTELEKELLSFPQGDHDDLIDSLQMTFEFGIFDVMPQTSEWDYFSHLGIDMTQRFNEFGEPV